jgi:hypothetical protein
VKLWPVNCRAILARVTRGQGAHNQKMKMRDKCPCAFPCMLSATWRISECRHAPDHEITQSSILGVTDDSHIWVKWEKGLNILFNLSNLAKACIDCCKINLIVAQVF